MQANTLKTLGAPFSSYGRSTKSGRTAGFSSISYDAAMLYSSANHVLVVVRYAASSRAVLTYMHGLVDTAGE